MSFPISVGQSKTLTLTPRDSNGVALTGRTVSGVVSSAPGVISVTPASGTSPLAVTVTGVSAGTATISGNCEGVVGTNLGTCSASASMTRTPTSLTFTDGGAAQTVTVTHTTAGTTINAASSAPSVCTVTASATSPGTFTVTPQGPGSATLTFTDATGAASPVTVTVVVNPVGATTLTASPNPISVQVGAADVVVTLTRAPAASGSPLTAVVADTSKVTVSPASGNQNSSGVVSFTFHAVAAGSTTVTFDDGTGGATPLVVNIAVAAAGGTSEPQIFLNDANIGATRLLSLKSFNIAATRVAGVDGSHSGGLTDAVSGSGSGSDLQATGALQPVLNTASTPTAQAEFTASLKMGMASVPVPVGFQGGSDPRGGYTVAVIFEAPASGALYLFNYGPLDLRATGGTINDLNHTSWTTGPAPANGVRRCMLCRVHFDGDTGGLFAWVDEVKMLGQSTWTKAPNGLGAAPTAVAAGSWNESSVGGGNGGTTRAIAHLVLGGNASTDEATIQTWAVGTHGVTLAP